VKELSKGGERELMEHQMDSLVEGSLGIFAKSYYGLGI
jgi:hypothetical protein